MDRLRGRTGAKAQSEFDGLRQGIGDPNDVPTRGDVLNSLIELGSFPIGAGGTMSREKAIQFSAFFRAISILSFWTAQLTTTSLRVLDEATMEPVKTKRAKKVLRLLRHSPDSGVTKAFDFVEHLVIDMLLDGNALAIVYRDLDGIPIGLRAAIPETARARRTSAEEGWRRIYELHLVDNLTSRKLEEDCANVIHARWPTMTSRSTVLVTSGRSYPFAPSPLVSMRSALQIGLEADKWIRDYFKNGTKSEIAVSFPHGPPSGGNADEKDEENPIKKIYLSIAAFAKNKWPLVLWNDAKITNLKNTPSDADAQRLREFQVREIGRALGVPPPILGEVLSAWGKGIEALSQLLYTHGIKPIQARLLSELSFRLLPEGQIFDIDETELVRGSFTDIAKAIPHLLGAGGHSPPVFTRQEIRVMMAKNPKPELGSLDAEAEGETNEESDDADSSEADAADGPGEIPSA